MSSSRTFRCLLVILWVVRVALGEDNETTTTDLPVTDTSPPPICISYPIDITPKLVTGAATIPFPEEVRKINVFLEKEISTASNGMTLALLPLAKKEHTTPLALLTATLTANATVAAADSGNSSAPNDTNFLHVNKEICARGDSYCYLYSEIHWGTNNESGSDHSVGGKQSPLEIRHFFWNAGADISEILGISVRYRIVQEHEVNMENTTVDLHNSTETDGTLLRRMRADDALMRRKRKVDDGKVVPGDPATLSDKELRDRPEVSTASAAAVTNEVNVTANVSSTGNTTLNATEGSAVNFTSATAGANPFYNETPVENGSEVSFVSQEAFEAFLKGEVNEIRVTLDDFLLPPGKAFYQYRGNHPGECDIVVVWLVYEEEGHVLPSTLRILRNMYSPSNASQLQQTHSEQMPSAVEVLRWPYPDPLFSQNPDMESTGSRLHYFNPIVFLIIPIIVLIAFFFL